MTAFGHCAIRIYDPGNRINNVYHYGVLNFNDPQFYWSLLTKGLYSSFEGTPYNKFRLNYLFFGRSIQEYPLNLTPAQKQSLFDFATQNLLPENKGYRYHYFTNNCSSKLFELFTRSLRGQIKIDSALLDQATYRSLYKPYLTHLAWEELCLDLLLGYKAHEKLGLTQQAFLPGSLLELFKKTRINNGVKYVDLISVNETRNSYQIHRASSFFSPVYTLALVGIVMTVCSATGFFKRWLLVLITGCVYAVTSIIGITILFGWLILGNTDMAFNLNLAWALPLNFLAPFIPSKIKIYYLSFAAAGSAILLFGWAWLPQQLNPSLIPVLGGVGMNHFTNVYKTKMSSLSA